MASRQSQDAGQESGDSIIYKQYDVKIIGDKVGSVLEPTIPDTTTQPAASPPPGSNKTKRPSLLMPQYKTATKDFIVCCSTPTYCS